MICDDAYAPQIFPYWQLLFMVYIRGVATLENVVKIAGNLWKHIKNHAAMGPSGSIGYQRTQ